MNKKAALYLRSSKDRHDVSIEVQRQELHELAEQKQFTVVAEFKDVVESAKSEHREGFQQLLSDLKSPERHWDYLLLTDTSRLSRRRYVSHAFKHEAEKRGVTLLYSKVPEVDPISQVVLESVFEAMDEVHSLMSREKGLAGMLQNVKAGYRAGGRAPKGYQLHYIDTGSMREGKPVTKTVLKKNNESSLVKRYLEHRTEGMSRAEAKRRLNITWPDTTLIGMEWNALTYAGHTVWNVHNETLPGGGYKNGTKRRPRDEWHIKHDTHDALISTKDAESLISRLENSNMARVVSLAKSGVSNYLLTGLLQSPEGENFYGSNKKYYRLKRGKWFKTEEVDEAITGKMMSDLNSNDFIKKLTLEAKRAASQGTDETKEIQTEIVIINNKISKATELTLELEDPAPMLRKIDELERQRNELAQEAARLDREHAAQSALKNITEKQVRKIIKGIDFEQANNKKRLIRSLVEKITLDPTSLDCRIHYKIECSVPVASPRGFEPLLPP